MSSDLEWLLLRGNNSFVVKRVPEGPYFSKEPGNLVNIHSQKYSGLANAKTIDVKPVANGIAITHRKKSASPRAIRSAHATTIIGSRTGPRRALGIAAHPAKRGYRPDLRQNPLETFNVMKDGRGHVCKMRPYPDGADQTPLGYRHTLSELVRRKARVADELAMTLLATLARVSSLIATQKEPKAPPPKKIRGKKAKAVA